ncbi:MAG: hypothetical protein DRI88_10155 [Bacteroidetes bacterium]|nr:MAG: hypothetical protein DRI88_10155 [Bacteroidota bacterium]
MIHKDFTDLLKSLAPFTEQELKDADGFFKIEEIKKNDFILEAGHVTGKIGYVVSGILRTYYVVGEREITTDFLIPGSIAAGMLSFLSDEPQNAYIVALEEALLTTITKKNLFELYHENWKWQQVGRLLMEQYFVESEERTIRLQSKSAHDLYEYFVQQHPDIVKVASLSYIASYLGMTPETLSRIRKCR